METIRVNTRPYSLPELGGLYALWLLLFFYLLSIAWVSEDAYITFRVIENFADGHGLRWNLHERVQAYTHPLWLLLHLPFHAVWDNVFVVNILLSAACAALAVAAAWFAAQKHPVACILFLLLPFLASKSVMDYSSSGLENPLSYLLFAVFGYVILRKQGSPRFWLYCMLAVSLALTNRLDNILLYAPALLYLLRTHGPIRWRQILLGALPLAAWLGFSLFYYGFIFPNTKYAKLGTDMGLMLYLSQGLHYAKYLLIWDTAGALILLSSLLFLLPARVLRWLSVPTPMLHLAAAIALGIALYSAYVVYIGGDYMAGRFWALPVFASICLWFFVLPGRIRPDIAFAVVCALATAYFAPKMLHEIRESCKECIPLKGRVIDAQRVFRTNKMVAKIHPLTIRTSGHYPFMHGGTKLRKENPKAKKLFYIGMTPYYAGSHIRVIDELGLADPLLARLPALPEQRFYIGHFKRELPKGYLHAVETGSARHMHPALTRYYHKLRMITSGELWNAERLKTIALFNLGYYDHWKDDYVQSTRTKPGASSAKAR